MFFVLDKMLFLWIYENTRDCKALSRVAVFVAEESDKLFSVIYFSAIIITLLHNDVRVLTLILGPATTLLVVTLIRLCIYRSRPFEKLHIYSLIKHKNDSSFPSKHAASAFTIAMAIWYLNHCLGSFVLVLACVTALSRVMVGVHYPSDIIFGGLVGVGITTICYII